MRGALPSTRASRPSHVPSGWRALLQPRVGIPNLAAPLLIARLLGEEGCLKRLLWALFALAGVSFCRSISHWLLWERNLRQEPPVDVQAKRALRQWMAAELLVSLGGWAGSQLLIGTGHTSASVASIPVVLVLLLLFTAATLITILKTSEHAEGLGLEPTTDVLRNYLGKQKVPDTMSRVEESPVWGPVYVWLTQRLAPKQVSGVAVILLTVPALIFAEGSYAIYSARVERQIERAAIKALDAGKSPALRGQVRSDPQVKGRNGGQLDGQACSFKPGVPAPNPWADQLYGLWYGNDQTEGVGSFVAGCPAPAEPELGHPRVWLEHGFCDGTLKGMAVAAPDYGPPAMLIQQAASIGASFAREGNLLGASPRTRIGDGDLYVFETPFGSFVASRLRRTYGPIGESKSRGGCARYSDRNVPYQLTPPGLVGIWLSIALRRWAWPEADGRDGQRQRFVFVTSPGSKPLGEAYCKGNLDCRGTYRGVPLPAPDERVVSAETLASLGPGP